MGGMMDLREATTPDDRQGPLSRAVRRAACGQGCLLMRVPSLTHHAPWRSGVRHSLDVRPPPSQGPAESVRRGAPAHPIGSPCPQGAGMAVPLAVRPAAGDTWSCPELRAMSRFSRFQAGSKSGSLSGSIPISIASSNDLLLSRSLPCSLAQRNAPLLGHLFGP